MEGNTPLSGKNIISNIFIAQVLDEEAKNIIQAQDRVLSAKNPDSKNLIIASRSYTVTGTTLQFTHAMQQRFIDMKTINGIKRKPIPVHNKVIYTHFNNIIAKTKYGLTESVQNLIANQHNIQL
ncbi:hypothetical protein [Winogradskyella pulchriflava]|uniref:Uncharacterized protein n=1 Tax=Winogradskyella pulchriflava TaxID=1110688 RepID=A0ABV6QC73_9FLAO